jgi:hypothetical protein
MKEGAYTMENKQGRPRSFPNPSSLRTQVNNYFRLADKNDKPITLSGLALALGVSRRTLSNYLKEDFLKNLNGVSDKQAAEYWEVLDKARRKCEAYAEERLFTGKNTQGVQFILKNGYGWKEKSDVDVTSGGERLGVVVLPEKNHANPLETDSKTGTSSS